jgi:hypothetical protein
LNRVAVNVPGADKTSLMRLVRATLSLADATNPRADAESGRAAVTTACGSVSSVSQPLHPDARFQPAAGSAPAVPLRRGTSPAACCATVPSRSA